MCATPDRCSVVLLGVGFHYNCLLKTTEEALVLWTHKEQRRPAINQLRCRVSQTLLQAPLCEFYTFWSLFCCIKSCCVVSFFCQAYYIVSFDYSRFISACFDYLKVGLNILTIFDFTVKCNKSQKWPSISDWIQLNWFNATYLSAFVA